MLQGNLRQHHVPRKKPNLEQFWYMRASQKVQLLYSIVAHLADVFLLCPRKNAWQLPTKKTVIRLPARRVQHPDVLHRQIRPNLLRSYSSHPRSNIQIILLLRRFDLFAAHQKHSFLENRDSRQLKFFLLISSHQAKLSMGVNWQLLNIFGKMFLL